MATTITRSGYRCSKCDRPFHADTPVQCPLDEYLQFIDNLRCSNCGAGPNGILMGLCLTEEEDRNLRISGSAHTKALNWYSRAETGQSSLSIYRFFVAKMIYQATIPSDLDDLKRCVRLLEHVPEWKVRMPEMSVVPGWERLATEFDRLTALFRAEAPDLRGPAPKTADLLRHLTLPVAA